MKASRGSADRFGRTIARRNTPSRRKSDFSRTRADAKFSKSQVAQIRLIDGFESAQFEISFDRMVAKPLPQ